MLSKGRTMTIKASVCWSTYSHKWEVGARVEIRFRNWLRLRLILLPGETTLTIGPLSLFVRN